MPEAKIVITATDLASAVMQKVGAESKSMGQQILSTAAGYATGEAALSAFRSAAQGVGEFIRGSIQSYSEAEQAQAKLTVALRNSGQAAPGVIAQYNALSAEFQKTTVYGDDLITSMQSLLTEIGGVMPNQMKGALQASTNLAAGLGIDLQQATMMVAKAAGGHTAALGKYGIQVDEADVKSRGLAAVLDAVNGKFGGQAAAELDTYAGRLKQIANAWDNVKEAVGESIVTNPLLVAGLRLTGEAAGEADSKAASYVDTLGKINTAASVLASPLMLLYQGAKQGAGILNDNAEAASSLATIVAAAHSPIDKLSYGLHITSDESEKAKREMAALDAQTQQHIDTAHKAAEAQQKLNDTIKDLTSSADLLSGAQVEAIRYYNDIGLGAADTARILGVYQHQVDVVVDRTKAARDATKQLADDAIKRLHDRLTELETPLRQTTFKEVEFTEAIKTLGTEVGFVATVPLVTFLETLKTEGGPTFESIRVKTDSWTDSIGDLSDSFARLAQVSGDSWGGVAQSIGTAISATDTIITAFKGFDEKPMVGKIGSLISAYAAMSQAASGGYVSGALAGASAGFAIGGPVGAGVGAGAGVLMAAYQNKKDKQAANEALIKTRDDFISSFADAGSDAAVGTFDRWSEGVWNLRDRLQAAGLSFEELYGKLAGKNSDVPDGIAEITRQLQFTDDSMAKANEYAQEFGLTTEQLGPKWAAQELDKKAETLFEKWSVLKGAGADMAVVNDKVGESANEMLHQYLNAGVEIPAAMRPMLEQMAQAGELTDAAGNKITDLDNANLNFSDRSARAFEKVGQKIDRMVEAIGRMLGITIEAGDTTVDTQDTVARSIDATTDVMKKAAKQAEDTSKTTIDSMRNVGRTFDGEVTDSIDAAWSEMQRTFGGEFQDIVATDAAMLNDDLASALRDGVADAAFEATDQVGLLSDALDGLNGRQIDVAIVATRSGFTDAPAGFTSYANEGYDLASPRLAMIGDARGDTESILHARTVRGIVQAAANAGGGGSSRDLQAIRDQILADNRATREALTSALRSLPVSMRHALRGVR